MVVYWNRGTPNSSMLMGFSIITHQFLDAPISWNPHICIKHHKIDINGLFSIAMLVYWRVCDFFRALICQLWSNTETLCWSTHPTSSQKQLVSHRHYCRYPHLQNCTPSSPFAAPETVTVEIIRTSNHPKNGNEVIEWFGRRVFGYFGTFWI
jgi:hypothetical protein